MSKQSASDLSTGQWVGLILGTVAFSAVLAAAGVTLYFHSWRDDVVVQHQKARASDVRPPDELRDVPEVALLDLKHQGGTARNRLEGLVQEIRDKNHDNPDGFVLGLIAERPDLKGLPFRMGKECKMDPKNAPLFGTAAGLAHVSQKKSEENIYETVQPAADYWTEWRKVDGGDTSVGVAALTQVFGPAKQSERDSVVRQLAELRHPDATRALAKATVFDFDRQVRVSASSALKSRPRAEYTDVLMTGLRYPWPAVAMQSAQAIVRLERKDLVPQLVAMLDEPDPREPAEKQIAGKAVHVLQEMVRINHHRNCLLCHPPATTATESEVAAPFPVPGEPFPTPSEDGGYGRQGIQPSQAIRADVTYLRQDFSVMQPVANAHPWPEMQRFDFFVRTRELNEGEVQEFAKRREERAADHVNENQKAVLFALRELTGRDAAPTAAAWREALAK